jgi:transposase
MIRWSDVPVYLHRQPVDFRKSINGLSALVEQAMGMSPFRPALFVFGARRRDKIKVLYWLESATFSIWFKDDSGAA